MVNFCDLIFFPKCTGKVLGVVGGTEWPVTIPYQVSVQSSKNDLCKEKSSILWGYNYSDTPNHRHLCAGVIIDKLHIITAAHCLKNITEAAWLSVAVGVYDLKEIPEQQKFCVKDFAVHEDYKESNKENEIALLRLHRELSFDNERLVYFFNITNLFAVFQRDEVLQMAG